MITTLFAIAWLLPGGPPTDYPLLGSPRLDLRGAGIADATMIVREIRRVGTGMYEENGDRAVQCIVDEVQVVDSVTIPKNTKLRLLSLAGDPARFYALVPGSRYLVIAAAQKNHRMPEILDFGAYDEHGELLPGSHQDYSLAAARPDEVVAGAALMTKQKALAKRATPGDTLSQSVAECLLDQKDEQEAARAVAMVGNFLEPGRDVMELKTMFEDDALTSRLKQIANEAPAQIKARIYQVLVGQRVQGSEEPFVQALGAASQDPDAFLAPPGQTALFADLFAKCQSTHTFPKDYGFQNDPNRFADIILNSKNLRVSLYMFRVLDYVSDAERRKRLAELLNSPEVSLREAVVTYFGRWTQDPTKKPVMGQIGTRYGVTNLDDLVTYWKGVYSI